MLAVVQAALRLTKAEDLDGFVRAIEGRVASLARAQTLLAQERWSGADLHALLRGELAGFLDAAGSGPKAALRGPRVAVPPIAVQPLSMAVHELATNALKYGALSVPHGRVHVTWETGPAPDSLLQLRWAESGGPAPKGPPSRRGFGTRVLSGTLRDQLGGAVSTTWEATGLVCDMEIPIGRLLQKSDANTGSGV
jgi:two-component sensor histidine kinase